ncbi:MAG: cytochrome P450 [Solirubrobacteraceae bacterium]|nr:cytochrome P450 [Solirubrobacteraceae bacterium]
MSSTLIEGLPPGPRAPLPLQTLGMMTRMRPYLERQRRRFGSMFTMHVAGFDPMVVVSDPALVKQVFKSDPTVLHAGDQSPLRTVLGRNSLLGIDEDFHLEQRRLLLPPFKGQRMKGYEELIEEITLEEISHWPAGTEFPVGPSMQRITLRAILRAIFGATGGDLAELEELIPPWTEQASRMSSLTFLQHDLGPRSPWGRLLRLRARVDAILDRLIETAKADPDIEERPDVLALLVRATHTDGAPMTNEEIRDQLVTMMAAGHETTAHQLSWAVERLRRHADVLDRLVAEADAGGKALREATIRESQRTRPVIFFAGRFVMQPYELAGYRLPVGTRVTMAAALTHFDPALFDRPDVFDPDRFLDKLPDTYEWIPFGGGLRRCIGATFAHMEMDVVLRVLLQNVTLAPTNDPDEGWRFRGVAMAPARGGRAVVSPRVAAPRLNAVHALA